MEFFSCRSDIPGLQNYFRFVKDFSHLEDSVHFGLFPNESDLDF